MPFSHDDVVAVLDVLDAPVDELTVPERLRVSEQLEDVRRRLAVARHQELAELMAQQYGVPAMVGCKGRPLRDTAETMETARWTRHKLGCLPLQAWEKPGSLMISRRSTDLR